MMTRLRSILLFAAVAGSINFVAEARAEEFAAIASPPRFEIAGKPGVVVREVLEIANAGSTPAKYTIKTADWAFDANSGVVFSDDLQAGSCRPWVAIERRDISVPVRGKYRYRFEVAPPADAPRGECRFALLIAGDEQNVKTPNSITFPVTGRLGVIVYVTIGDAQPDLEVVGTAVVKIAGEPVPVIRVRNNGDAHGRLAGFLSGVDASGRKIEFAPSTLPILPKETRALALVVNQEGDAPLPRIVYPITISGKLEWGDRVTPFEQRFAP